MIRQSLVNEIERCYVMEVFRSYPQSIAGESLNNLSQLYLHNGSGCIDNNFYMNQLLFRRNGNPTYSHNILIFHAYLPMSIIRLSNNHISV